MIIRFVLWLLIFLIFAACKTSSELVSIKDPVTSSANQIENRIRTHPILSKHFTGFVLYDPITAQNLIDIDGDKLFTPASNTKLLTYYAAKSILGDSIPALSYHSSGDSLIIRGTGDPLFLGRFDQDSVAYNFLKNNNQMLFLDKSNFRDARFGSGWAWDDYNTYYQKEITSMPIYSNGIKLTTDSIGTVGIDPKTNYRWFNTDITLDRRWKRGELDNAIRINPERIGVEYEYDIPIHFTDSITLELLSVALGKNIQLIESNSISDSSFSTLYHTQSDSLYKALMIESDNYIAEQLLLCVSHELLGVLDASAVIDSLNRSIYADAPNKLRWVDGSGLSRYNLISPHRLIWTLKLIQDIIPRSEIEWTFPTGQKESTLDSIFSMPLGVKIEMAPFLYAKTGTLSNNHNMSGYITTKDGHRLIFSFMNNHYTAPNSKIRQSMHEILSLVYDHL